LEVQQQPVLPWDNPRINDEKAKELLKARVLELTLPPHNLTRKNIALFVNRSETKVYQIQRELVEEGKLNTSVTGHIIKAKPDRQASKYQDLTQTQFMQIDSVLRWRDSLIRSNVKKYKYLIVNFWKVCKTLDVHPDVFLIDDFKEINPLVDKFIQLFKDGKIHYLNKNVKKNPLEQSKMNPQHYLEAIRSFIKRNGLEVPDGELVIQRKAVDRYAHSKLTDSERLQGITIMSQLDHTFGDIFTLHNEIGVRTNTLFTMKPTFEKFVRSLDASDENDEMRLPVICTWYKTRIWEEKQEKAGKGGYFEKYIFTPKAKAVVERLKDNEAIHNFTNINEAKKDYNEKLRQLYATLGIISKSPIDQKKYEEGSLKYYFVEQSTGVIRHSCVHWLMRITGNNAAAVSSLFWEKTETLDIYAKQTFDDLLQVNDCAFCRPPVDNDNRYRRFDNLKHALIYYNNGGKTKKQMIEEYKNARP